MKRVVLYSNLGQNTKMNELNNHENMSNKNRKFIQKTKLMVPQLCGENTNPQKL